MKRDDSGWVSDLFAAGARDWTPGSARHAAYVLYAPVSRDREVSRRCGSVLSDTELQRADRFLTEDGKAQFQQRRAFRRYCGACVLGWPRPLSQITFLETEKGRPYLPELPSVCFSFSSCRLGVLAAWSSTHSVGIDLEDPAQDVETTELARRFFSEAEARAVEGACPLTFFHLWNLKEAALKSIGEGLPMGLDAFEFELTPNLRVVHAPSEHGGPEQFSAHIIDGTVSCAALVICGAD
jgi:phosphopantetheinyl transferase